MAVVRYGDGVLVERELTWWEEKALATSFCDCAKKKNRAGYTATPVAYQWAGAVVEVTRAFGQGQ